MPSSLPRSTPADHKVDPAAILGFLDAIRSEEHTSELQSHVNLVCRLLLEKKKRAKAQYITHFLAQQLGDISRLYVLDVGSGIGNYHPLFSNKVRTVTVVDVSSECIATAC